MSLTVIIASHNRPDSLRRAVVSALAQPTVDEIIVVDDASIKTPDLVGLDADRIRLECHQENRGVCAARNTGLSLVHTTHVAFLDDDDRLLPDAYQPLLEALVDSSSVVVGIVVVEEASKVKRVRHPPSSLAGQIWGLDEYLLGDGQRSFGCKQSAIYPTQLLRELGGWNEALRSRSHSELFLRLCTRHRVIGVDYPVYALIRGESDHLSDRKALAEASYQYVLDNYEHLLSDPIRRHYFERVYRAKLRRFSPWYRGLIRIADLLGGSAIKSYLLSRWKAA